MATMMTIHLGQRDAKYGELLATHILICIKDRAWRLRLSQRGDVSAIDMCTSEGMFEAVPPASHVVPSLARTLLRDANERDGTLSVVMGDLRLVLPCRVREDASETSIELDLPVTPAEIQVAEAMFKKLRDERPDLSGEDFVRELGCRIVEKEYDSPASDLLD